MEQTLEDVLNEYVAEAVKPNGTSLQQWIRLYPQYERELTEFTENWLKLKHKEGE